MIRNENYAIYNGKEYSADFIEGEGIMLRSQDAKDIENGFENYQGYNKKILYIKIVDRNEVSEFYNESTYAIYKGFKFEAIDEKDNMVSIVAMTGDYRNWLSLGMKCIDKGVYQKWVQNSEVELKVVKEVL